MGFSEDDAGAEDNFRSIILFGANVASYKFALGASLLDLADTGVEKVTLEELAAPFSRHLCDHLAEVNVQGTYRKTHKIEYPTPCTSHMAFNTGGTLNMPQPGRCGVPGVGTTMHP